MPVFRVLASRTELYLIESFIQAADRDEAEETFYAVIEGERLALSFVQDFDSSETEVSAIEPLSPDHDAVPAEDRAHCLYCGRSVQWTGTAATASPTGMTIPGPWIHAE